MSDDLLDEKCRCCCQKIQCYPTKKNFTGLPKAGGASVNKLIDCLQQPNQFQYYEVTESTICAFANKINSLNLKQVETDKEKKCYDKKFYQFGLIAKIDSNTKEHDLKRLLKFSFRTFLIQVAFTNRLLLDQIVLKLNTQICNYQNNVLHNLPMGLAIEIRSDVTRLGRMRNDCIEEIKTGSIICLTAIEEYEFVSVKEILFVSNLWRYLNDIKVDDIITLDNRNIILKVIKTVNRTVSVCVINGGVVSSFMEVNIPYYITTYESSKYDCEDVQFAYENSAHFLVIPKIRSYNILKGFKDYFSNKFCQKYEIIGKLDLNYLRMKTCEICDILKECTAIWIEDLIVKCSKRFHINKVALRVISIANNLKKPIIATIPIKTRKDFISLEKAAIFKSVHSFLIEKSDITQTFPIIAKKLLPIPRTLLTNFKFGDMDVAKPNKNSKPLMNTVNFTIHNLLCSGIIVTADNIESLIHLTNIDVYCPVIAITQNDYLAKTLNIYRNINSVLFTPTNRDESETEIFRCGIYFGVDLKIFEPGDLILRFEDLQVGEMNVGKMLATHIPKELISIEQRKFLSKFSKY